MAHVKDSFKKELWADHEALKSLTAKRYSFSKIGFIEIEPSDGYLRWIRVRAEYRGQGWGDRLIVWAKQMYPHLYGIPESEGGSALLAKHGIPSHPVAMD